MCLFNVLIGAYYDDEVNAFVDNDDIVLYAFAVGK